MLPSDLLMTRYRGEEIIPKRLPLDRAQQQLAEELIAVFAANVGQPRRVLEEQLQALEGTATDYRVKRGLAHLLQAFAEFEVQSPLEPETLRRLLFEEAAQQVPSLAMGQQIKTRLAERLSVQMQGDISLAAIEAGMYADLAENHILQRFDPPSPEALLHRYNLAQVQGLLYRARDLVITAYRNDPGEYKQLFRYLKLFGLMSYIEGDADHGFSITIDGPASVLRSHSRYGTDLAKFLPALLKVSRWRMDATLLRPANDYQRGGEVHFGLDSDCGLVSHYRDSKVYDSAVEEAFAQRFAKTKTDWRLEREVDLIPIPGSVMIPDFRLVHPEKRPWLFEIVGYWRPSYLQKKFAQVRQAQRDDLLLAVSQRLNLGKAGIKIDDVSAKIIWFKGRVNPQDVLAAVA